LICLSGDISKEETNVNLEWTCTAFCPNWAELSSGHLNSDLAAAENCCLKRHKLKVIERAIIVMVNVNPSDRLGMLTPVM
jgi:hypothetical protein